MSIYTTPASARHTGPGRRALVGSVSIFAMAMMALPAHAQTSDGIDPADEDVMVVTGSRATIQESIALKRTSTQIVDGLSAEEIGDLPALSIGEALENITGVASHRENGGATEVSIRGLGPYLSSTVVNGRAATNGSGDRSVNFSLFPSELVNKLAVFKTQDASQIEGGVAGQIQLETIKPLDFGKRRVQFEAKGFLNPDQFNQDDTEAGDIGYRLTGSYTDQFAIGGGDLGIAIGGQYSRTSNPEAEARQTSPLGSSRPACLITDGLAQYTDQTNGGTFTGFSNNPETRDRGDDDCDDFNDRRNSANEDTRGSDTEGFDTAFGGTGLGIDAGTPFAFAPSQRAFRQNDTSEDRDAIFGTIQYQPNDRLEINIDGQYSERTQAEIRNDLVFNGGRRNDTSLNLTNGQTTTTLDSLVLTPQGGILRSITDGNIEIGGGDFKRVEQYTGLGLNVNYDVTDRLSVSADVAHSSTERTERALEFRIQSDISPVIEFDRQNSVVPLFTLTDEEFDVNDPTNYVDRLRVRIDNDVFRDNTINAGRFDVDYDLGDGFFTNLKAGVRFSDQDYLELPGGADTGNPLRANTGRFSFEIENDGELTVNNQEVLDDNDDDLYDTPAFATFQDDLIGIIQSTNEACFEEFQESDFLSNVRNGNLVTNLADDGSVLSATNSFATFNANCVANTAVDSLNGLLGQINALLGNPDFDENSADIAALNTFSAGVPDLVRESDRTIDVQEQTTSFYLMTNYDGMIDGSLPISGNIGARVVQTSVEATGFRSALIVNDNDGELSLSFGDLEAVTAKNDYTRILPSANMIMEVAPNKLVRLGVFRALSRADPADMGFGREILQSNNDGDDDVFTSVEELIGDVRANGNPELDPLMSWNYDASFEWYPNKDTILAVGGYYKQFQGGFENVRQNETFTVNGQSLVRDVSVQQVSEENSNLFGIELTASHGFTYLPGFLSGLGAKLSYNYVESNFEFEDSRYGDAFTRGLDGTRTQTRNGIIAPGGLPGLSKNTLAAQVYYGIGELDLQVNYKYRDEYFQPFISDGTRLRYVGDVGVWEARASYNLTDNFRLSAEAINIGSEPKRQFAFVNDDQYEVNDYGPRFAIGLRGRF